MVLDDATSSPQDGWAGDALPSSDSDGYSVDSRYPLLSAYRIDVTKLPQPIRLFGNYRPDFDFAPALERTLEHFSREVRRPLTKAEAETICYAETKTVRTASMAPPLFMAAGAARCYQTAATFRFPLYQPNPVSFNPNSFFRLLSGQLARGMWHSLRLSAYGIAVSFSGLLFVGTPYASMQFASRVARDPQLRQYNQDRRAIIQERSQEMMRKRGAMQTPDVSNRQNGLPSGGNRREVQAEDDDMSPTSNDYSFPKDDYSASNSSTANESQTRYQSDQNQSQPSQSIESSFPDSAPQNSSSAGASAWDRVRAQAAKGSNDSGKTSDSAWSRTRANQSGGQRGNSSGSGSDDSFSFSSAEEDRELAKSEAQKEFDARIERERRGKDF